MSACDHGPGLICAACFKEKERDAHRLRVWFRNLATAEQRTVENRWVREFIAPEYQEQMIWHPEVAE